MTTYIQIKKCSDSFRWYAPHVGKMSDYVPRYDTETEYGSREPAGYINFVLKEDAELITFVEK
jgi:hypothetical protein